MPKALLDCVREVEAKIKAGKMPAGSSAWGVCIAKLKKAGVIKRGKGRHWTLAKKK